MWATELGLAMLVSAAWGALEPAMQMQGGGGPLSSYCGALTSMWGVALWALVSLLRAGAERLGLVARARQLREHRVQSGEAVAQAYVWTLSVIIAVTAALASAALAAPQLERVQDDGLRHTLLAAGSVLVLSALLAAGRFAETSLASALVQRASACCRPERFLHIYSTALALVASALFALGFHRYGRLVPGLGWAMFVAAPLLAFAAARSWLPARVSRHALAKLAPLAVLGLAVAMATREHAPRAAASATFGAGSVQRAFVRLLDFDRDGFAAWPMGRDCAPFDPRRNPAARDAAGDGTDADCDGRDGGRRRTITLPPATSLPPLDPRETGPYNVILLVVDALRADHVTSLGYGRATTPNIDRLSAQSWSFERAFSQAPATAISFPSFFTGVLPMNLPWETQHGMARIGATPPTLAELLRARGYRTTFLFNGWFEENMEATFRGFEEHESVWPDRIKWREWSAHSAASSVGRGIYFIEDTLRNAPRKPFFLTLYLEGPHAPYDAQRQRGVPAFGTRPVDRYDAEIAFVDRHVGVLLDYLAYRPELWQRTIVILTADHGEEFGEHGATEHGHNCHRQSTHVPLIVRIPDEAPRTSDAAVGLIDIMPTVLERVGAPLPALDGRTLRWAFSPAKEPRPLYCESFDPRARARSLVRAVRSGGLLLFQDGAGTIALFDTEHDPLELTDLGAAAERASERQALLELLAPFAAVPRR